MVLDGKTGPREVPLHPAVQALVRTWWRSEDADPLTQIFGVSSKTVVTRVQEALADAAES
jgi:hypothetical protein